MRLAAPRFVSARAGEPVFAAPVLAEGLVFAEALIFAKVLVSAKVLVFAEVLVSAEVLVFAERLVFAEGLVFVEALVFAEALVFGEPLFEWRALAPEPVFGATAVFAAGAGAGVRADGSEADCTMNSAAVASHSSSGSESARAAP